MCLVFYELLHAEQRMERRSWQYNYAHIYNYSFIIKLKIKTEIYFAFCGLIGNDIVTLVPIKSEGCLFHLALNNNTLIPGCHIILP
jgi:hypothetical protein